MAVPVSALAVETSAPSLYASLLGPEWAGLPAIVRTLHQEGRATGRFSIRRGRGPLAALLGWLCRFPRAGEDVPTRLVVRHDGPVQRWERAFAGHGLVTTQWAWADGLLGEQLGPVVCVFRLRAAERGIVFEPVGAWLCLGPWRVRLPRVLAPLIEAETAAAPEGMHVRVRIRTAFAGALLTYEGHVRPEEPSP